MFSKIYEKAISASKFNKENIEKRNVELAEYDASTSEEEKIRDYAEEAKWIVFEKEPTKDDVWSEELLNIIHNNNFNILEYAKRVDEINYYEDCGSIMEYYTLSNDKYKFIAKYRLDVDIDEGILSVNEVENLKTGEVIEFYLDLGCRNTGKAKFNDFLLLISCDSQDEYVTKKFAPYLKLPEMLEKYGYKILDNTVTYSTERLKGFIRLDEKMYIVPYTAWHDEVKVVVTNNPKWDVNDSNDYGRIGYYVEYSLDNFDVLVENIEAFKRHISGKYGYLEKDVYFKNNDIDTYFGKFTGKDKNGNYRKAYNNRIVEFEKINGWDGRGYGNRPYINLYKGLEMARHYQVTINPNCGYGYDFCDLLSNLSDIVIKYDTSIDKKNCILLINNYQYKIEDGIHVYDEDEDYDYIDKPSKLLDQKFLVDTIEFHGSFTECISMLDDYLMKMFEIFEIDIEER